MNKMDKEFKVVAYAQNFPVLSTKNIHYEKVLILVKISQAQKYGAIATKISKATKKGTKIKFKIANENDVEEFEKYLENIIEEGNKLRKGE